MIDYTRWIPMPPADMGVYFCVAISGIFMLLSVALIAWTMCCNWSGFQ